MGSGRQRRQLFEEQLFANAFLLIVFIKKTTSLKKKFFKSTKIIQNEVQATTP